LKASAAAIEAAGDPQGLAVEFEHVLAYLAAKREGVFELQDPSAVVAGIRNALEQFEETARRVKAGEDPYAGRTGDMRRAFRSAATGKTEQYRLYVPTCYADADSVPFIMILHGGGQIEDTFPDMDGGVILGMLERAGYLMVSPNAGSGYRGDGQLDLLQLIDLTRRQYPKIDPSRMYCTGLSRGGFGTYGLVTAHPELFAAACCVSGTGSPDAAAALKDIPLLILQGGSDTVVRPAGAQRVAAELERLGYTVDLHIFPTYGHNYHAVEYMKLTLDFFGKYRKGSTD
jgi:predicted peptidase